MTSILFAIATSPSGLRQECCDSLFKPSQARSSVSFVQSGHRTPSKKVEHLATRLNNGEFVVIVANDPLCVKRLSKIRCFDVANSFTNISMEEKCSWLVKEIIRAQHDTPSLICGRTHYIAQVFTAKEESLHLTDGLYRIPVIFETNPPIANSQKSTGFPRLKDDKVIEIQQYTFNLVKIKGGSFQFIMKVEHWQPVFGSDIPQFSLDPPDVNSLPRIRRCLESCLLGLVEDPRESQRSEEHSGRDSQNLSELINFANQSDESSFPHNAPGINATDILTFADLSGDQTADGNLKVGLEIPTNYAHLFVASGEKQALSQLSEWRSSYEVPPVPNSNLSSSLSFKTDNSSDCQVNMISHTSSKNSNGDSSCIEEVHQDSENSDLREGDFSNRDSEESCTVASMLKGILQDVDDTEHNEAQEQHSGCEISSVPAEIPDVNNEESRAVSEKLNESERESVLAQTALAGETEPGDTFEKDNNSDIRISDSMNTTIEYLSGNVCASGDSVSKKDASDSLFTDSDIEDNSQPTDVGRLPNGPISVRKEEEEDPAISFSVLQDSASRQLSTDITERSKPEAECDTTGLHPLCADTTADKSDTLQDTGEPGQRQSSESKSTEREFISKPEKEEVCKYKSPTADDKENQLGPCISDCDHESDSRPESLHNQIDVSRRNHSQIANMNSVEDHATMLCKDAPHLNSVSDRRIDKEPMVKLRDFMLDRKRKFSVSQMMLTSAIPVKKPRIVRVQAETNHREMPTLRCRRSCAQSLTEKQDIPVMCIKRGTHNQLNDSKVSTEYESRGGKVTRLRGKRRSGDILIKDHSANLLNKVPYVKLVDILAEPEAVLMSSSQRKRFNLDAQNGSKFTRLRDQPKHIESEVRRDYELCSEKIPVVQLVDVMTETAGIRFLQDEKNYYTTVPQQTLELENCEVSDKEKSQPEIEPSLEHCTIFPIEENGHPANIRGRGNLESGSASDDGDQSWTKKKSKATKAHHEVKIVVVGQKEPSISKIVPVASSSSPWSVVSPFGSGPACQLSVINRNERSRKASTIHSSSDQRQQNRFGACTQNSRPCPEIDHDDSTGHSEGCIPHHSSNVSNQISGLPVEVDEDDSIPHSEGFIPHLSSSFDESQNESQFCFSDYVSGAARVEALLKFVEDGDKKAFREKENYL